MGMGELAALAAAFLWTLSSMIWGRIKLTALNINLCKNVLGSVLILVHVVALAIYLERPIFSAPAISWWWLSLSGLIGVVAGDTLYFRSLQILGPRRALMMATSSPIFSAILGWTFLKESLSYLAVTGIGLTIGGVLFVVADRKASHEAPGILPGRLSMGIATGSLAAVCQAVGGVFSKLGMRNDHGVQICNAAEATFIRLVVAAALTWAIVVLYHRFAPKKWLEKSDVAKAAGKKLRLDKATLMMLIPATALGTWLGIWFSQVAYNHADVAIAQTLLATCPLFAIPIVWYLHKHRVTWYSLLGTIVALGGIALVVRNH